MPYIDSVSRKVHLDDGDWAGSPGELNYQITKICQNYIRNKGLSYQSINDILGALEGAKLEFNRRVVADYEDEKIKQNGDVY